MSNLALATCSQESDDGAQLSVAGEAESPTCCVYFLVSAAESGPLHGLLKVGIADYFPARYRQHTQTWGPFDLSRSALLRVRSRREAEKLENALHNHFGDPIAESDARAAGKTLTSEDFITMGSWRRYPGRRDDGSSEFFAYVGLARMLSYVEDWQKASDGRRAGTRLQRGISPTECSTQVRATNSLLTRVENRELRERRRAAARQFGAKMQDESNKLMGRVLGFAQRHREHLLGVDLRAWRKARAMRDSDLGKDGFVCLYFRTLEDELRRDDPKLQAWWTAQHNLQKHFAPINALANSVNLNGSGRGNIVKRFGEGVSMLGDANSLPNPSVPRPVPHNMVSVLAGNCYSDPFHPLFGRFEKLEQMVEGRRTRIQTELRW